MKTLININPIGAVIIHDLGRTVEAGGEFECPDDIAGVPPFWRPATDADDLTFMHCRTSLIEGKKGDEPTELVEVLDLGQGLLAQVGNYQEVQGEAK